MGWSCGATRGRTSPPDRVRAITLAILCELLLAEKLTAFPCSSAPASNLPQRMLACLRDEHVWASILMVSLCCGCSQAILAR